MLLLHANEVVPADALAEAVWGESSRLNAMATLQVYIANLRKTLTRDTADRTQRLLRRSPGYCMEVAAGELDLHVFRQLAEDGRAVRERDPLQAAALLRSALGLWRGTAFPDLGVGGLAPPELAGLEEHRLSVLEDRFDAELDAGLGSELVAELDALVSTYPLRERLHGQRIVALYRAGQQASALQAYRTARQTLVEELGIDPGPELQRLERAVLQQDPRLEACVPAARSRPMLPAPTNALIGRRQELAALETLLGDEQVRVVSLVGPGGSGKSRLALEVAHQLQPMFPDGVFFVPLASVTDPRLVLPTLAHTLRVKETAERSLGEVLADRLDEQVTLLVLDNFEQVLPAATAVAELVRATPSVKFLVTSRAPLRISAEHQFQLPPLLLPDLARPSSPGELMENEAVRLFVERARAVVPDFELTERNAETIARICHRIDGLPLAVELAAARTRVLAPDALLERLDARLQLLRGGPTDVPTHQQTLRGTIAWSYDLLDRKERALFTTCAVFAGGFTFDALEAVCPSGEDADDVLDTVEALVGQSLLVRREVLGGLRFGMLYTIRDYAQELLGSSSAAQSTHARHAGYYRRLAEAGAAGLVGPEQADWLARLQAEHGNLRAALAWSTDEQGDPVDALTLAGSLAHYWEMAGALEEGRTWLDLALRRGEGQPPELLLPACSGAGTLAWARGDHVRAAELHQQALCMARQTGNRVAEAFALNNLGAQANERLDFDDAIALFEQAAALAVSIEDEHTAAMAKHNLAEVRTSRGELTAAAALYDDALRIFRALGDQFYVAASLRGLAWTALRQDDHRRARDALQESLTLAAELGENSWIAEDLESVAALAEADREPVRATVLLSAADGLRRRIGSPLQSFQRPEREALIDALHAHMGDGAFDGAWTDGQNLPIREAIDLATQR